MITWSGGSSVIFPIMNTWKCKDNFGFRVGNWLHQNCHGTVCIPSLLTANILKKKHAWKYSDYKIKCKFSLDYFFGITLQGLKGQIEAAGEIHTPDGVNGLDTAGLHRLCCAEHPQALVSGWCGMAVWVPECWWRAVNFLYLYHRTLRKPPN